MKRLKVALVHDYLKEYGGAERVLETLHEIYPDAPVFTSVYLPEFLGPHRKRFEGWDIRTSWFQYVPFNHKLLSPFRLISSFVFKQFDFSGFDIIISSATGAYFPNNLDKKQARLISYCHTPPRYLYGYATAREWKKHKAVAALASIANHWLRMVDFTASENVDSYIANSEEVRGRIKKFYRKDAVVINPPVDTEISNFKFQISNSKLEREYFITGGRLARAKHVDLVIQACADLGVPLKVFGRGFAGYEEDLKSQISNLKNAKIDFVGEVNDEKKMELLSGAKAFLFASEDEDFGILPVEAMSVGTPVIAHRSGGVRETVIEGKTGMFFDHLKVESLKDVITKFEKKKFIASDCRKQAEKFSKKTFQDKVSQYVSSLAKKA